MTYAGDEHYPVLLWLRGGRRARSLAGGVVVCLLVAAVAVWLGSRAPLVGAPVFALLLGLAAANVRPLSAALRPGVQFCSRKLLQVAIVVMGGSLSLVQVLHGGRQTLAVMLITQSVALSAAWVFGKALHVPPRLLRLVGVGTGICGGSAIAAIAPIIAADDDEIAFSISTVFLFNIVAVVLFPAVGHWLHLSQRGFGLWAGTAINDTSSVVAAGYAYGRAAGDFATITKLARTTMIVPISLAFAVLEARQHQRTTEYSLARVMPWFILGFLGLALANTLGLLGQVLPGLCATSGKLLIVVALAGVGLGTRLDNLARTGARPILLGLLVWVSVALTSLGAQWLGGQI